MPKLVTQVLPLRELRLAGGLSATQMANALSQKLGYRVSPQSVAMIERRGVRKVDIIMAIAAVLNIPIEMVSRAAQKRGQK